MRYAYARESSISPSHDELRQSFLDRGFPHEGTFVDRRTKIANATPRLDERRAIVGSGDTVFVWNGNSLGRTIRQLTGNIRSLIEARAQLAFLKEKIGPDGSLALYRFSKLLDRFWANCDEERHLDDVARASSAHRKVDPAALEEAITLYVADEMTIRGICLRCGISHTTLYRELERRDLHPPRRASAGSRCRPGARERPPGEAPARARPNEAGKPASPPTRRRAGEASP